MRSSRWNLDIIAYFRFARFVDRADRFQVCSEVVGLHHAYGIDCSVWS